MGLIGSGAPHAAVGMGQIAESVAIYLGIPFAMGLTMRLVGVRYKGHQWFDSVLMPPVGKITLIALLFTIIVMFCLKAKLIVHIPLDVLRIAIPLAIYFAIMFMASFSLSHRFGLGYSETVTVAFTGGLLNKRSIQIFLFYLALFLCSCEQQL